MERAARESSHGITACKNKARVNLLLACMVLANLPCVCSSVTAAAVGREANDVQKPPACSQCIAVIIIDSRGSW